MGVYAVFKVNADEAPDYADDALDMALPMWKNKGGNLIATKASFQKSNVDLFQEDQYYFADKGWGTRTVGWAKLVSDNITCNPHPDDWPDCGDDKITYIEIWLNSTTTPFLDGARARVIGHEFGHGLGLGHWDYALSNSTIMIGSGLPSVDPTSTDVRALNKKY
ncbi:hypothetical protein [Brevibacillus daliensis]|uniref:hypothetical protein n=1 Tax=Brevibacillus daliensis TaxID=2892995 RepID=UPI001E35F293|nr:hypothetical protein [Brevibacillus daliensis]